MLKRFFNLTLGCSMMSSSLAYLRIVVNRGSTAQDILNSSRFILINCYLFSNLGVFLRRCGIRNLKVYLALVTSIACYRLTSLWIFLIVEWWLLCSWETLPHWILSRFCWKFLLYHVCSLIGVLPFRWKSLLFGLSIENFIALKVWMLEVRVLLSIYCRLSLRVYRRCFMRGVYNL